jgi:hypothetical protein
MVATTLAQCTTAAFASMGWSGRAGGDTQQWLKSHTPSSLYA